MASDLYFDPNTREIIIDQGDFSIISNASIQKGDIIQYSHGAFLSTPALGIGMENIIGTTLSMVAYEMNRWAQQCLSDGAKRASWDQKTLNQQPVEIEISTQIYYE